MTYKKNFVAAIKTSGKILRESSDRVELPFGSEYSILLKNLDSVRMQARISIDGKDVTDWLVIGPGQDIEVERFIEDLNRGNRFKFIERTEAVENYRGIKLEDGLIRVEFKREKVYPVGISGNYYTYYPYGCYPWAPLLRGPIYVSNTTSSGVAPQGSTLTSTSGTHNTMRSSSGFQGAMRSMNMVSASVGPEPNDAGITVQGSISNQQFVRVPDFETETAEVVILHLVGKTTQGKVTVPKTVKTKLICETCNTKNVSSAKFCWMCGTSLERV